MRPTWALVIGTKRATAWLEKRLPPAFVNLRIRTSRRRWQRPIQRAMLSLGGNEHSVNTQSNFCQQLHERLLANKDKVLLRVVSAANFDQPLEFTGATMLRRAEELAGSLGLSKDRSVVLLLLPHSAELFLLHLGLVLKGHVPA